MSRLAWLGAAALLIGVGTREARAGGDVTITLTPDGQEVADQLGVDVAELERRIEERLAAVYDTANVEGFLRTFANATSFANRGTGIDYAPVFRGGELGVAGNLALAVEGLEDGQDPAAGIAPVISVMGGLNLSRWGHPEWTLYGNGMHYQAGLDELSGTISNAGVHAQYHLFYPAAHASALFVQWSGVHVSAGLEMSRWAFHADQAIERSFTIAGDNGNDSEMTAIASGRFELSATAWTIPIEITTSARALYFAGVYAGAGVDVQLGGAETEMQLDGTVRGTRPSDGSQVDIGAGTVTATGEGSPSKLAYHVLLGVEANVWRLKLFAQATLVPFDGASFGFGMRVRL